MTAHLKRKHAAKRYLLWLLFLFWPTGLCAVMGQTARAAGKEQVVAAAPGRTYGPATQPKPSPELLLNGQRQEKGLPRQPAAVDPLNATRAARGPSAPAYTFNLAATGPEEWSTLPLFGGEMTSIVQDPFNANTVYVGTRDAGVFKTTDGGVTWNPARQGLTFYPIRCLAADPVHSGTFYAGTDYDGVWKTTDGASTWFKPSLDLDEDLIVFNIAINPQDPVVLYAGMAGGAGLGIGNIYKSNNGGFNWVIKDTGIPRNQSSQYTDGILSLALDPANPATLYAGTISGQGVFRTIDGGDSWSAFSDGLPQRSPGRWERVVALATDPSHDNRAAASCWWYGYCAYLSGTGWTNVALDKEPFTVNPAHLYFHPTDPSVLYFAGEGFMSSTDGGQHWETTDDYYESIGFNGIAFHPSTPNILFGSREPFFKQTGGVQRSVDQGKNWVDVSTGITAAIVYDVATDPEDPRDLYVSTGDDFFYYSYNKGSTWSRGMLNSDFSFAGGKIALDPRSPNKIYAALGSGLALSTDKGQTFHTLGVDVWGLNAFLFPEQAAGVIYLVTSYKGIYKSSDDGATWVQKNNGLPQSGTGFESVLCLVAGPQQPDVIWAGTQAGLVKTTDGGDHWQVVGFTGDDDVVRALAFHPTNPQVMYASAGTLLTGNIYKSTDGGQTWQVKAMGYDIGSFVFDPRNPKWIYAAANWDGVLRSMDGGETWYPFNDGIFCPLVYSIAITNEAQPLLLAGSYGSGLYSMRAPVPVMRYAFPRLSYKPGLADEGFGFVNTGTDPAQVIFTAYDTAGTPVKTSGAITWPGGAQAAYQADGLMGLTAETDAWVLAESNQSTLRGFFLSEQYSSGLAGLDGAAVFTSPMTDGVLPMLKTTGAFTTELFVANPGAASIQVALVGYDGTQAHDGGQRTIPARGFLKLDAAGLFSGAHFDGYLRVVSDGGFIGSATIRYAQASLASVNFIPVSAAAEKQYAAHVTRWPSLYYSDLNLVNPSAQTVHATIDTYYTVPGESGTHDAWKWVDIPPYQIVTLKDKDLGLPDGKVSDGWIKVEGWRGNLLGCVTFGQPGENQYLSILPLQAETEMELWFAQVANGNVGSVNYFTGLAVVNPNTSPAQAVIKVYASDGTQLGQATVQLAAYGKYVNMLRQIPGLTGLPDQASGYIRVSATQPVVSFVLFGDTALNFLSAVPAQR